MTEKQINPFPKTEGRVAGVALAEGGMVFLKWQDGSQYGYLRDAAPYGRLCPIAFDFLESLAIQQQATHPAEQPRGEPGADTDVRKALSDLLDVFPRPDEDPATGDICRALAAARASLAAQPKAERAAVSRDPFYALARGIKECRGEGQWRPCSGCYDTEDGHPTQRYMHSNVLGCDIGNECRECGGMGVVWQDFSQYETTSDDEPEKAVGDGVGFSKMCDYGGPALDVRVCVMRSGTVTGTYPTTDRGKVRIKFDDGEERTFDIQQVFPEDAAPRPAVATAAEVADPNIPTELDELRLHLVEAIEERDHLRKYLATTGDVVTLLLRKITERVEHYARVGKTGDHYTDGRRHEAQFILDLCNGALASRPVEAAQGGVPSFQARVSTWMEQCFLPSLYSNMTERGDRLLEEVLELLQSKGYDPTRIGTLVKYVWNRPMGEPSQEVGGVMVTLAGYCWIAGLDMHECGDTELARINRPEVMAKIRAKQKAKNALHFDTPLPGDADRPATARDAGDGEVRS